MFEVLLSNFILGHSITWNFLDSIEDVFNTLDLVISSTHMFATYLEDVISNIPVFFVF